MASKRKTPEKKPRGVYEKNPGSGVWYVHYSDQYGRRQRYKVGTFEDAVAEYHKQKRLVEQGRYDPESVKRKREVLVSQAIKDFLDATSNLLDHKKNVALGKMWSAHFGDLTLTEIRAKDVEKWVTVRLREGAAPATVNRGVAFLKRLFNHAVRNADCASNPVARFKMQKENNARVRFLTDEEQDRLLAALPLWAVPIVLVAIGTGMRISEQLFLLWANVDFAHEVITIPRSKHGEKRHVPMSEEVVEIMRGLPSRLKSPLVFPRTGGEQAMSRFGALRRAFTKALAEAHIDNLRWHDLRHTFASRLAMAGVGLLDIKELMGHKSLAMVQRYAHLSPDHLRLAVGKIRVRTAPKTAPTESSDLESLTAAGK